MLETSPPRIEPDLLEHPAIDCEQVADQCNDDERATDPEQYRGNDEALDVTANAA
jgi:hypothetical protein